MLDEVAGHIGDAIAGVIIAGRQTDPELREPLAHLARASGFPILAEPTSQLRLGPHDRSYVVTTYDTLLRDEHWARGVVPELVLRFGELPTSQAAADLARGERRRPDRRRPERRLERADRPGGGDPARRSDRVRGRLGGAAGRAEAARAAARRRGEVGSRPSAAALDGAESMALGAIAGADGAAARSTSRRSTWRSAAPIADGDLVYTASSMPIRDQETFLGPGEADVLLPLQPRRQRDRRADLLRDRRRRTRAAGRPRSSPGTSACSTTSAASPPSATSTTPVRIVVIDNGGGGIFHFLPQQAALGGEEFEALLGTPRGVSVERAAALFDLPYRRLESLADLPAALAAGTGLIEVRTDRQPTSPPTAASPSASSPRCAS